MRISIIGSSLVSSYWNGAATYYRGLTKGLSRIGADITFYEPDIYERQTHRDIDAPSWAKSIVYGPRLSDALSAVDAGLHASDVLIVASGIGAFDAEILSAVMAQHRSRPVRVFLDVDAPATLDALFEGQMPELRRALPRLDAVLTFGGGSGVVKAYHTLGARLCAPIYNAADPEVHHPVAADPRYAADLSFLGNRLPDREHRVGMFLIDVARRMPEKRFLIGGSGWNGADLPANVRVLGHVSTSEHNAFNGSARAVLNVSRESMAAYGFSPATRVFEAAAAGALMITDAWEGIDHFFTPGREILVAQSGADVESYLDRISAEEARAIGDAARVRCLASHTYETRARDMDAILRALVSGSAARGAA